MNKFVSKQTEAAAYTVQNKEVERQEIARQIAEFEARNKSQKNNQGGHHGKRH